MKVGRSGRDVSVSGAVVQVIVTGLVALVIVAVAGTVLVRRAAESQALASARELTRVTAEGIVQPALTDAVVKGDANALRELDDVVRTRVVREPLVRIKIWTADGRIVYSDEPRLIGSRYRLSADDAEALEHEGVEAEVSDLSEPENRFERAFERLLEVYLPISAPSGERLLYEAYIRSSALDADVRRQWLSFLPALIGALVFMAVIQVPLAWSLARRVRIGLAHEDELLRRAVRSSELERRRIAADLHDGVVQDLAGVSYRLEALARDTNGSDRRELRDAADATRRCIGELRTLLVEIYPPNLREAGLEPALRGLVDGIAARGIDADLRYERGLMLTDETEAFIFRAAQEALRNVTEHARANSVSVSVSSDGGCVTLEVSDDGRGFDTDATATEEGHLGLRLLSELAEEASGTFELTSQLGRGTSMRLEIPR